MDHRAGRLVDNIDDFSDGWRIRPVLTAEVTFLERTPSGRLRQPVWRGLIPS
jgi:bifunctional non-homologous end joining protein LigD